MPPEELNLDEDGNKSGPGKMIIMIVLAVLLIGGSVGGTLYFSGGLGEKEGEEVKKDLAEILPTLYLKLEPEFVVNFSGEQAVSYIQLEIQLMARQQVHLDQAVHNMPILRHQILLLLSGQKYSELRTIEGKEKLRADILSKVQEVLGSAPGASGIEAVYFTMFIMQ